MKIKNIKYIGILSLLLAFTSCNEIDLEPQQEDAVGIENGFNDIISANAAVNGMYELLYDRDYYGRELMVTPDVASDNVLVSPSNSGRYLGQYQYSILPTNGSVDNAWVDMYQATNTANAIINYIDNVGNATPAQKNELLGQAFAIKGLTLFDAVRTYAFPYNTTDASVAPGANGMGGHLGVPMLLDFNQERHAPRATVADVYTQAIDYLTRAISLLPTAQYAEGSKLNKNGAKALLARVYLYKGDYSNAFTLANQVIADGQYSLTSNTNYMTDWNGKLGSNEAILQLPAAANDNNGFDSLGSIYTPSTPVSDDGNGGYGDLIPTTDLTGLYSATDARRGWFRTIGGVEYNYKFPNSFTNYIPLIRLSEMYLIVAEAAANGAGTPVDGQNALNAIAQRADPSAAASTSVGAALLTEVLNERRKELAFEGHRLYDLVRNKLGVNRTDIASPSTIATIAYPDFRLIWPIPQAEVDANDNINENNIGY